MRATAQWQNDKTPPCGRGPESIMQVVLTYERRRRPPTKPSDSQESKGAWGWNERSVHRRLGEDPA